MDIEASESLGSEVVKKYKEPLIKTVYVLQYFTHHSVLSQAAMKGTSLWICEQPTQA